MALNRLEFIMIPQLKSLYQQCELILYLVPPPLSLSLDTVTEKNGSSVIQLEGFLCILPPFIHTGCFICNSSYESRWRYTFMFHNSLVSEEVLYMWGFDEHQCSCDMNTFIVVYILDSGFFASVVLKLWQTRCIL